MAVLHLLEQSATARLRAGRVCIEVDGHALTDVPARKVGRVVVHGNIRFSTPLLTFFLKNGVPILYLSLRGRLYGLASAGELAPPTRLQAQFAAAGSALRLELAGTFVGAKLESSVTLLAGLARRGNIGLPKLDAITALKERVRVCNDLERLRGLEGLAARHYYAALQGVLSVYGFTGRNRRPPRGPVNAALSYGYALLLAQVLPAVLVAGLHPEVGMLHAESRRNPALALDLMEEFRVPVVDVPVFRAFLRGALEPLEHFEDKQGGIYLNEAGRKTLIPLLEARLEEETKHPLGVKRPFRGMIELQAQRLAAAVEGRDTYVGFYPKR